MGYEDKMAEHLTSIKAVLVPGEEIVLNFYGIYNIKGFQAGGNPDLTGTWAASNKQLLFIGKAKFTSGWSGFAKAGHVITIPYPQIVDFILAKQKIKIIHTAEHEGKKEGAKRSVTMMPHRLPVGPSGKKENDKEWIARAESIYNQINKLRGH